MQRLLGLMAFCVVLQSAADSSHTNAGIIQREHHLGRPAFKRHWMRNELDQDQLSILPTVLPYVGCRHLVGSAGPSSNGPISRVVMRRKSARE